MFPFKAKSNQQLSRMRIAIVGAGHMGRVNLEAVKSSPDSLVSGIFDPNIKTAQGLADKSMRLFEDYEEVLQSDTVDGIFIAVPHHLLSSLALRAAAAKKHVIVEKPMSITLEDATKLLSECRRNNVRLTANYWLRYLPAIQYAKALIHDGCLGDVIGATVAVHQHKPSSYWAGLKGGSVSDWRALRGMSGGGMLIMTACHAIDYLQFVTGLTVDNVSCRLSSSQSAIEVEEVAVVVFAMDNGAIGDLATSSNMRGSRIEEMRIWGKQGTVVVGYDKVEFFSTRRILGCSPGKWHVKRLKAKGPIEGVKSVVNQFVTSVVTARPLEITPQECWRNLAIVRSCYDAHECGRVVSVPKLPKDLHGE